jgi:hypothetical protein
MSENLYLKFRFKEVKLSNFDKPSPNLAAPIDPILLSLIYFKNQYSFFLRKQYNLFNMKQKYKNYKIKNFYQRFRFKLVKFCNFETPSPNFAAPSSPITSV